MEDHGLDRSLTLLRDLPPERARPGFTGRVLAALDERPAAPVWRRPRLVFAAAALLAVTTSVGIVQVTQVRAEREAADRAEARRLLRELRSEHDDLKHDFETLSTPPVVYVGGNEQVDLVVDLSRVQGATY